MGTEVFDSKNKGNTCIIESKTSVMTDSYSRINFLISTCWMKRTRGEKYPLSSLECKIPLFLF